MIKGEKETLDAFRNMQISVRNFLPQMAKNELEGVEVECVFDKGKKCNTRCSNYPEILSTKITFGLLMKEIEAGGAYSFAIGLDEGDYSNIENGFGIFGSFITQEFEISLSSICRPLSQLPWTSEPSSRSSN